MSGYTGFFIWTTNQHHFSFSFSYSEFRRWRLMIIMMIWEGSKNWWMNEWTNNEKLDNNPSTTEWTIISTEPWPPLRRRNVACLCKWNLWMNTKTKEKTTLNPLEQIYNLLWTALVLPTTMLERFIYPNPTKIWITSSSLGLFWQPSA